MTAGEPLSPRAIASGTLLGMVTAMLAGSTCWAVFEVAGRSPQAALDWLESSRAGLVGFVLSLVCTAACGFVSAHAAQRREAAHAAVTGLLFTVLGALFAFIPGGSSAPPWAALAGWGLTIPAAVAGGLLAGAKRLHARAA